MSATVSTESGETEVSSARPPRVYGFSVLLTGLARIGRQPLAFILIILLNAAIQGLLTYWTPLNSHDPAFYVSAFVSFASRVISFALTCQLGLATVDGKITLGELFRSTWRRFGLFFGWVLIELVAIWILTVLYFWPGMIFMLLIRFVALAAMDGQKNANKANFLAIKERVGRYLVTMVFWILIMVFSDALVALGSITLSPSVVAFIGWVYRGFIGVWLTCAFAGVGTATARR